MTDTCDVEGCENDARAVAKNHDEFNPVIAGKQFCAKHIQQLLFTETDE